MQQEAFVNRLCREFALRHLGAALTGLAESAGLDDAGCANLGPLANFRSTVIQPAPQVSAPVDRPANAIFRILRR